MRLLSCLLLTAALVLGQVSGEVELIAAAHKEKVEGNLKGAIEAYRQIVAKFAKQPEIAARALLQLGQCQEKLGETEARKSYERIVREYGGAQQYASAARARLAAMDRIGAGREMRTRLLWDRATPAWGTVSADGRYLSIPDHRAGKPAVRDLVTGETKHVTKSSGGLDITAISADGKQVAFDWCWGQGSTEGCELRIANVDGTGERVLMHDEKHRYISPGTFSPDGKWLSAQVDLEDGKKTVLVSLDSGEVRTLPVSRTAWRSWFSPDGKWLAFNATEAGEVSVYSVYIVPADGSRPEAKVATEAVFLGWAPDGASVVFARRREGAHQLYQLPVAGGRAAGEAKPLQSATIPSTRRLGLTRNGSLLYELERFPTEVVFADFDVNTASVGPWSKPVTATGVGQPSLWLGGGARFSPDGKSALILLSEQAFSIRSLADGSKHWTQVQSVWQIRQIEWAADSGSLYALALGSLNDWGVYQLHLVTGLPTLVVKVGGHPVFAFSPDGRTLYWWDDTTRAVHAKDLTGGTTRTVAEFNRGHLYDMRVSHDGKKLALMPKDRLWIMNVSTGETREMQGPSRLRGFAWSPDDRRIVTIETGPPEIASYPVDGGEPVRRPFPEDHRGVWLSPDGKRIATMHMEWLVQVWALENFLPPAVASNQK